MALQALGWLSSNLGVDITGESSENNKEQGEQQDIFAKIGSAVFGDKEDENSALPASSDWGYEYNQATGQWEPTGNAPEYIHKEQQDRITEMNAPPPVVAPPPMMSNPNINYNRDVKGPKYADHFNSYGPPGGQDPTSPPNAGPTSGPTMPIPSYQPQSVPQATSAPQDYGQPAPSALFSEQASNCINTTHRTDPQSTASADSVVQEQKATLLQFATASPSAPTEQSVANTVQYSAATLPPQGSMLSAQMPDALIQ